MSEQVTVDNTNHTVTIDGKTYTNVDVVSSILGRNGKKTYIIEQLHKNALLVSPNVNTSRFNNFTEAGFSDFNHFKREYGLVDSTYDPNSTNPKKTVIKTISISYISGSGASKGNAGITYNNVADAIAKGLIAEKKSIYKDPNAIIRSLAGLTTNRGLYGRIFVMVKSTNGYSMLFPTIDMLNSFIKNDYYKYHILDGHNSGYSDFLITNISIPQREIAALEQGFGDYWDLHFYGRAPVQLSVSGALLNAYDVGTGRLYDWAEKWLTYYDLYFRGGVVAQYNARMYLVAGNYMFSGYILSTTQSTSQSEGAVPFAFNMIVTSIRPFSEEAYALYIQELKSDISKRRSNNGQ